MAKKKWERRGKQFKKQAVEQMESCANISALSQELGVARRALYNWKAEQAAAAEPRSPEQNLRRENARLKQSLPEKVLQLDFFAGALRRIEERRRPSTGSGGTPSTSRSGK
ncbi:MAG: transposase [Bryobacteraceae bacterium]|jgi:hypothetical protein